MVRAVTTGEIANTGYLQKTIKFKSPITFGNPVLHQLIPDSVSFGSSNPVQVLPEAQINEIIQKIETRGWDKIFPNGTTSIVYQFGDKIVKTPKPERLLKGDLSDPLLEKEKFALEYVKNLGLKDSQEYLGLASAQKYGKAYLFSTFMDGKGFWEADVEPSLKDLIKKLTHLDQNGFTHLDLQCDNIYIDKGKARLMDFGGFGILKNDGNYLMSDVDYKAFFKAEISDSPAKKFLQILRYNANAADHLSRSSNPYLCLLSNVENFEYRSLHYRLLNPQSPNEAQDLFRKYLKVKADDYHTPMAEFLKGLKAKDLTEEALDTLNKAIQHEEISARLLGDKNVLTTVQKTELGRIQLRFLCNEKKYKGSPELKGAFDRFRTMVGSFEQNAQGESKIYFSNALKLPEWLARYEEACPATGTSLPESEDILKVMFKKAKEIVAPVISETPKVELPETVPAPEIIKKGIGKKWLAIGVAAAAVIGFGMHLYNSHKKQKTLKLRGTSNADTPITQNNTTAIVASPTVETTPFATNTNQTNPFSNFNFNRQEKSVFKDFLVKA